MDHLALTSVILCFLIITVIAEDKKVKDDKPKEKPKAEAPKEPKKPELQVEVTHDIKSEKCERRSKKGDLLEMHYTGTLAKGGAKFDSSHDRKMPFRFQLGVGDVIQGWDQGLVGMCVGEKRKLTIPSHLAYGEGGGGDKIPPNADLIFDVELMRIEDGPKQQNIFDEIDTNKDRMLSQDELFTHLLKKDESDRNVDPDRRSQLAYMRRVFRLEDLNGDGHVTPWEYRRSTFESELDSKMTNVKNKHVSVFIKKQMEGVPANETADPKEHDKMIAEIFQHEDKDKDGFISHEEFNGPKHDEL